MTFTRPLAACLLVGISTSFVASPTALGAAPAGEASIVPDQPTAPQGWFLDVEGSCPTPDPDGLGSNAEISVGGVKIGDFGPQSSQAGVDRYTARLYLWPTIQPGPTTLTATCTSGATVTTPFTVTERAPTPGAALNIDDPTPTGQQSVTLSGACPAANELDVFSRDVVVSRRSRPGSGRRRRA